MKGNHTVSKISLVVATLVFAAYCAAVQIGYPSALDLVNDLMPQVPWYAYDLPDTYYRHKLDQVRGFVINKVAFISGFAFAACVYTMCRSLLNPGEASFSYKHYACGVVCFVFADMLFMCLNAILGYPMNLFLISLEHAFGDTAFMSSRQFFYYSLTQPNHVFALILGILCMSRLARECRMDFSCPKCAYNLKGNQSGVCPECGTPIPPGQAIPGVNSASTNPVIARNTTVDPP